MKLDPITTSILFFIILTVLNTLRINQELDSYNEVQYNSHLTKLETITTNVNNLSNSLFDNLVNIPTVIKIFKNAHISNDEEKGIIRKKLYDNLKNQYSRFTQYGVQQLHFHLPNNDSFLRFHKPKKFGDNLTNIRESVKYVNEYKKPTI